MKLSDKKSAQYLYQFCKQLNINQVVICPGSRNLPLVNTFSNDLFFNCVSVIDERSAGFVALGMAKASKKPALVISTSGTAALNLSSAIAEAYYQRIPLIVVTADRPKELIGKGENQTINQVRIYSNYIQNEIELEEKVEAKVAYNLLNSLLPNLYGTTSKGPIHINTSFSEPLNNLTDSINIDEEKYLYNINIQQVMGIQLPVSFKDKKVLFYISECTINSIEKELLNSIIHNNQAIVCTEFTTNIYIEGVINHFDKIVHKIPTAHFPDIIITYGQQRLTKNLQKLIGKDTIHIDVARYIREWDTLTVKYHFIQSDLHSFLELVQEKLKPEPAFVTHWSEQSQQAQGEYDTFVQCNEYKEFHLVNLILDKVSNSTIYWGNSSLVRYVNWSKWSKNETLHHQVNRGVSGIDGVLSSAIGYQVAAQGSDTMYCILGDVSLLYELNALQLVSLVENFKIIVFNNGGGEIFNHIHSLDDNSKKYLNTAHKYAFDSVAKMFDIQHFKSSNKNEFAQQLEIFVNYIKNGIFEINIPSNSLEKWSGYWDK